MCIELTNDRKNVIKVMKRIKSTSGKISTKTTTKTVGKSMPMYRGWG